MAKSSIAIHVATEAKWSKQITGTISYVIASKLVPSLRTHRFCYTELILGGKKSDFFLFNIIRFWQFRKVDITSDKKRKKIFTS